MLFGWLGCDIIRQSRMVPVEDYDITDVVEQDRGDGDG